LAAISLADEDNPSALVEVSDELAALINGTELPEAPTAPTETTPAPTAVTPVDPTPLPATSTDATPEWFADVPEDQRAGVVQRLIDALPEDKRNSLPAIQQTARNASQAAAQSVQQQTQQQIAQGQRDAELTAAASNFAGDLVANLHPDSQLDVEAGLNNVIQVAQAQYHDSMAGSIEQGLFGTLGLLGVQEIPAATVAAISAAPDYGSVIRIYGDFFANRGFELGKIAQKNDAGVVSDADKAVLTARYKQWGIAQAAKDGRLRLGKDEDGFYATLVNEVPPTLGSTADAGTAAGEITQEEFDSIIGDVDKYDAFMANPANKARWQRALASVGQ